jgi:transcriptional regulator with XRE-family HTH domain
MTQTDLAARIGVSQGSISDLERGRIDYPKAPIRRSMAEALKVSHLDLLIAANELTSEEASVRRHEPLDHPGSLMRDWLDLGRAMTPDELVLALFAARGMMEQLRRYPGLRVDWSKLETPTESKVS